VAITLDQTSPFTSTNGTSNTTLTTTFGTNPVAGSTVVLVVMWHATVAPNAPTDNASGNTWVQDSSTDVNHGVRVYRASNINLPGSGTLAITVTKGVAEFYSIQAASFLGVLGASPLDTQNTNSGGSGTTETTASVGTLTGDLYIGGFSCSGGAANSGIVASTGTLLGAQQNGSSDMACACSYRIGGASPLSIAWTSTSSFTLIETAIASYKAAPAVASGLPVAQPGQTWRRYFKHRQQALFTAPLAVAAAPIRASVFQGARRANLQLVSGSRIIPPTSRPAAPSGSPAGALQGVKRRNYGRPTSDWSTGGLPAVATRTGAQWIQAPLYNSGGLKRTLTSGARWPAVRRARSRSLPALLFNSGGLLPEFTQGVRRNNLTRPRSRSLPAPLYNSGGSRPVRTQGVRRPPPARSLIRSGSQFLVAAPTPITPAVASAATAEQKAARPTRARSRLVISLLPIVVAQGAQPTITRGARHWLPTRVPTQFLTSASQVGQSAFSPSFVSAEQKPLWPRPTRARSRFVQPSSPLVVQGARPSVLQAIRRKPPTRAASDWTAGVAPAAVTLGGAQWVQPPIFNSGGLRAQRAQGIRRANLGRPASRQQLAARFNSGGQLGSVLRATQKPRPTRVSSRVIIATPSVVVGGVLGLVFQESLARRRTRPTQLRARSRVQAAIQYNSGGQLPRLTTAIQKPRIRPTLTRWLPAPRYNSGGSLGELTQGLARRPLRPLRSGSRLLGGIPSAFVPSAAPRITRRSTSQPEPGRSSSRWLPAQRYNSGGVTPSTVRGVCRKPGPVKPSRLVRSAPYNSGGLKPLFRAVPRQKPPTRPHSYLPLTGVVDLGLSRDITLLLGVPGSRWQMQVGASRWQLGAPSERWKVGSSLSRWVIGIPDDRWKDKPPGT